MEKLRGVVFNIYVNDANQWQNTQPIEGYFHSWGEFSEAGDAGVARWTVAIVEAKDGKIYRVPPEGLQFLE